MALEIETVLTEPFAENTYILRCPTTRRFAVVDPGNGAEVAVARRLAAGDTLERVLLTHAHIDHVWGLPAVLELDDAAGVPVHMHEADEALLAHVQEQGAMFGIPDMPPMPILDRSWLWGGGEEADRAGRGEGSAVRVGETELVVLFAPGHSPGSVLLYWGDAALRIADGSVVATDAAAEGMCLVGDVVICGSVGRTDLPGGDAEVLARSVRTRVAPLPGPTVLLGGHCGRTTVAETLATNPVVREWVG